MKQIKNVASSSASYLPDWKEQVERYRDKALTLAILFILFTIIVFPQLSVKPYEVELEEFMQGYVPPSTDPPKEVPKFEPVKIQVVFSDVLDTGDIDDIPVIDTIDPTVDVYEEKAFVPAFNNAIKNRYYEDKPFAITTIAPRYPEFYKKIGVQGTVVLDAEILEDGTVGRIEVVQSLVSDPGGLDDCAIEAVKKWKFSPAKVNNNPVTVWVKQAITFELH